MIVKQETVSYVKDIFLIDDVFFLNVYNTQQSKRYVLSFKECAQFTYSAILKDSPHWMNRWFQ